MQLVTSCTQLHVHMVSYDWQEVTFQMRAEWRFAWAMSGALYVMTPGEVLMLLLCVDNWDIPPKVWFVLYLFERCLSTMMPTDAVAFSNAHFGAGVGPIYLDNVGCSGSESNLINCSNSSFFSCYNGHSEDAGVRCQGRHLHIVYLHSELLDHNSLLDFNTHEICFHSSLEQA